MELRPPEECFHLAASATHLLNSTSYNMENCTYEWIRTTNPQKYALFDTESNRLFSFYQLRYIGISSLSELL